MLRAWFEIALWKRILLALVAGVIVGSLLGESAVSIKWIGDLFVRLIRKNWGRLASRHWPCS